MTVPPAARGLAVAAPFVLAAGLALLFDVVREIPVDPGCGSFPSPAEEHAADVYANGAIPLHVLVIAWTVGAIVLLSYDPERPRGFGRPTLIGFGLLVLGVVGAVALSGERAVVVLLAPLALIVIGFVIVAGTFTAPGTAIVAALALGATSVWIYRGVVDRDATYGPRAALWVLAVLTGAHLLLVLLQGESSYFC